MTTRPPEYDRGQSILIIPAAFLILLSLGTITLEAAALHLRQRQLDDLADTVASDAVAVGFDTDAFRSTGRLQIDRGVAAASVPDGVAGSDLPDAAIAAVRVTPGAEPRVEVDLAYEHEWIIGRAIFGASTTLDATGTADLIPSQP